jgi:hypothetical protein
LPSISKAIAFTSWASGYTVQPAGNAGKDVGVEGCVGLDGTVGEGDGGMWVGEDDGTSSEACPVGVLVAMDRPAGLQDTAANTIIAMRNSLQ